MVIIHCGIVRKNDANGNVIIDIINYFNLVCLNEGSGARIDKSMGKIYCLDLTLVTMNIAPKCTWVAKPLLLDRQSHLFHGGPISVVKLLGTKSVLLTVLKGPLFLVIIMIINAGRLHGRLLKRRRERVGRSSVLILILKPLPEIFGTNKPQLGLCLSSKKMKRKKKKEKKKKKKPDHVV